jgi:hypothetical protein
MASFLTPEVLSKLQELVSIEARTADIPDGLLERISRLLRPASGSRPDFTVAIKQRLRQGLLENTVFGGNSGAALAAEFEKEVDIMRRANPMLLSQILPVLEPLSFSLDTVNKHGVKVNALEDFDHAPAPRTSEIATSGPSDRKTAVKNENQRTPPRMMHGSGRTTAPSVAITPGTMDSLMPIVPPYHTTGVEMDAAEVQSAWVTPEVEVKLLKDILYIFQVTSNSVH